MPSQAATVARHKAEKAARKRARAKAHRAKEAQRRRDQEAELTNAKAGSRAKRAAQKRLQEQRDKIAQARQDRQDRAAAQAADALERQRAHDKAARDMKTDLQDFDKEEAKKAVKEAKQAQADANEKAVPIVKQPAKKKGNFKGKKIGAINEEKLAEAIGKVEHAKAFAQYIISTDPGPGTLWYTYVQPDIIDYLTDALDGLSDAYNVFGIKLTKEGDNG
jgi:hypothetical protein